MALQVVSGAGTLQGYGTNDSSGVPISGATLDGGGGGDSTGGSVGYSSPNVSYDTGSAYGGSYGSGATSYSPPDPYAAWGGKAAYDSLVNGYNTQNGQILATAGDAASNAGIGYNSSILDFLDTLKSGQTKIDNQAVDNELAKKQGTLGVLGMVSRGIKSGGVMLGNKNAGDSSAVGALANAYGDIGRRQLSTVGNQYAQGMDKVNTAQQDLWNQRTSGVRKLGDSKSQIVNNIVIDARTKLAALDGQIASSNLPNRINIEAEKEQVRQDALNRLQQYDAVLQNGWQSINPATTDQNRSKALSLFSMGQAPDNAFTFTDQAPAQFQGQQDPAGGNLPIYTAPKGTKQDQLVPA